MQDQANLETQSRTQKLSDPEMCVKTPCFVAMQSAVTEKCSNPPGIALQCNTIKYLALLASILLYMVLGILIM